MKKLRLRQVELTTLYAIKKNIINKPTFFSLTMFKKIFKNVSYLFASQIISKLLFLLQIVFIARYLGAEGLGKYAFVFAFGGIFFIFANLGLTNLTIRELAKDKSKTAIYFSNLLFIKTISCLVIFSLMILISQFTTLSKELKTGIILIAIILALDSFISIFRSIFRAFEKMQYEAIIELIHNFIIVSTVILLLVFGYGFLHILNAFIMAKIIAVVMMTYFTLKYFAKPIFKLDIILIKNLLLKSLPFLITGVAALIIYRIDIIMLEFLKGSAIVGLYEAGYLIISNLQIFPVFLIIAFYPSLSNHFKDGYKLKFLYKKATFCLLILSLFILIGVFIFGKSVILLLFGKEFLKSVLILKLISIGGFFLFLNLINVYYLNAINKAYINVLFFTIGAILNVILNLMLIPQLSYVGAGIATIVSYFVIFVGEFVYVKKHLSNTDE